MIQVQSTKKIGIPNVYLITQSQNTQKLLEKGNSQIHHHSGRLEDTALSAPQNRQKKGRVWNQAAPCAVTCSCDVAAMRLLHTGAQMNLSIEKKLMDLWNRFVIAKGEGEGVGWTGNLGLTDANNCLWNG